MHIDNTYLTNRTLSQPDQPAGTPQTANATAGVGPPAPSTSTHVPSPELLDLLDQVQQTPEVRPEVLQRIAERLASGYYLTRDAAEQTAAAIQQAQE